MASISRSDCQVSYRSTSAGAVKVFYREAGDRKAPTLLLLHGFPTSSHMFRDLIPILSDRYHIVAPDPPGFGFSDAPDRAQFKYTFEHLTDVIDRFTEAIGLRRYALYIFDYGAPVVGLRLALRHPERPTAIVSQNGNAYEEGLSDGWNPIQKYWKEPTAANRGALRELFKPETTKFQYIHGASEEALVAPESYTLDSTLLARPGNDEIQLDLFLDYASNVALYSKFQEYFRPRRPPLLAVWGKNDPFFLLLAPKHSSATTQAPKYIFTMPATSRSRLTSSRSAASFANSSAVTSMSDERRGGCRAGPDLPSMVALGAFPRESLVNDRAAVELDVATVCRLQQVFARQTENDRTHCT